MTIKSWHDIAIPHKDVLSGDFSQSEFAVDLTRAAGSEGSDEYCDAEKFYQRTYITQGLRELLSLVAKRVSAQGGEPVVQLQTGFGGGKTHSLLAIYHMLNAGKPDALLGIDNVLQESDIERLPHAKVIVLDGNAISPSEPRRHGDITINTLCGELAYRLGGADGYALVQNSDRDGTSPGKEILRDLLTRHAPCVILMDELVAYMRQLDDRSLAAGTRDSNLSFIQALTEAVKAVPDSMLLVSLPETEEEAGGAAGMQVLGNLNKIFARVRQVWRRMEADEAYKVVVRRLFKEIDLQARDEACREIAQWYREHAGFFPEKAAENAYEEELKSCYPFHPELFSCLYKVWAALPNFQQTRGVLKLMAPVINYFWQQQVRREIIMPGDMPLNDPDCRSGFTSYLEGAWGPVIDHDIDGAQNPIAGQLDMKNDAFGKTGACTRVARAVFLASAPSFQDRSTRGIDKAHALLAGALPAHSPSVYEDALNELNKRCHYLSQTQNRYQFDLHLNLQRQMEEHKKQLEDDVVTDLLRASMQKQLREAGNNRFFHSVHVFTPHADIPDDAHLRLVVLSPSEAYSDIGGNNLAANAMQDALNQRGEQAREYKNSLLFLAADYNYVSRLTDIAREYLAWRSIQANEQLTDTTQIRQLEGKVLDARDTLEQTLKEAYMWLLAPSSAQQGAADARPDAARITRSSEKYVDCLIDCCCKEHEWVIDSWAPVHLKSLLEAYYWTQLSDVPAAKIWQDMRAFLYMPRLKDRQVLHDAISAAAESRDNFAVALGGKDENDAYVGFSFGDSVLAGFNPETLMLISPRRAREWEEQHPGKNPDKENGTGAPGQGAGPAGGSAPPGASGGGVSQPPVNPPPAEPQPAEKRLYAITEIAPNLLPGKAHEISENILQILSADISADIKVTIEIEGKNPQGFARDTQRTVKENCRELGFDSCEFSKDE